jgi:hypothetical protein
MSSGRLANTIIECMARAWLLRPKKCKEAMDLGLEQFKAGKYQEAINLFNLALELPGGQDHPPALQPSCDGFRVEPS